MRDEILKTLAALNYDAYQLARNNKQTIGEKNDMYLTLEQLDNLSKVACPADCHVQQPYGFVVDEGCPVHDIKK